MRLEVDAAGIEQDAFADERDFGTGTTPSAGGPVLQVRDAGAQAFLAVALRYPRASRMLGGSDVSQRARLVPRAAAVP